MARIPYPDVGTLPETMRRMLAGTPLNIVRMGAHASPTLFEAQGRLGYAVADPAVLAPRLRETAILRVAHLSNSRYELHHHIPLATAAGLSTAELTAIGNRRYGDLDPLLAAICRFVDEIVISVGVTDATLAALRAQVSNQVLVNLVLTVGCYMSIARLIAVTGIEPDEASLTHLSSGLQDPSA
ncbi:MAG TPA: carboxymuconolactone decarboxylase family protein [Steroidobacteraceae bacterium]|nr:carboxymuconolactone decarboxylase family protein [Steroidobacteraceae bacterium]